MLQSFSDRIRNSRWLGYAIVIAISIPFALWGVQAYFGGADPNVAATVNGERILSQELEQRVSQRRQMLRQRFDGELPAGFSDRMLREQVLEEMITRAVLRQAADGLGLRVSEDVLAQNIRQQSFFRRDGEFSRELYQQTLAQAGLTPEQYEAQVRAGQELEQLRGGVARTGFALSREAQALARLQNEERRVALVERARDSVEAEPTAEEIRAYYEANQQAFQRPRQVRAAYIEADLEALRDQVEVPAEEIRAEYESNRQQYRQAAERRASHILIEVPGDAGEEAEAEARAEAQEILDELESGAAFDELAREHSDDPGSAGQGGDLGFISRGNMVEPFEEALFGLEEPGDLAGPVRTQYGFHVIRLEAVREPEPEPFEAVEDEIRQDLATRRAERLFYDRVELLRNTTYENPGSLEPAAEATGFRVDRTEWFSRNNGSGIASSQSVRQAAFSDEVLEERRNSDLIELGPRRVVVFRVVDERPPEPKPLEAVREEVRQQLVEQRVEQALKDWADEVVERLRNGADPSGLADATEGVTAIEASWVSRGDSAELPRRAVRAAFELPPPGEADARYDSVATSNGRGVVILTELRSPEPPQELLQQARSRRADRLSQAETRAWIEALKADADIVRQMSDDPTRAR